MPKSALSGHDFPSPDHVRAALERVVRSEHFVSSPRLRAFLQFVVDETLAGNSKSLKAYTIAVSALGRRSNFDPVADASVRVEAGRLRTALGRYYDDAGASDGVVISLPLGGYIPDFRWREDPPKPGKHIDNSAQELFAERERNLALFRENVMQLRSSVAVLHEQFTTAKAIMAQSKIILDGIRDNETQRRLSQKQRSPIPPRL